MALLFIAISFCISAICFSSAVVLSCASFRLFSRATASSCSAVTLACKALVSTASFFTSPADSFTTSLGPVLAGIDLSSAAVLILPPDDCVEASLSAAGAESATMPANLLR